MALGGSPLLRVIVVSVIDQARFLQEAIEDRRTRSGAPCHRRHSWLGHDVLLEPEPMKRSAGVTVRRRECPRGKPRECRAQLTTFRGPRVSRPPISHMIESIYLRLKSAIAPLLCGVHTASDGREPLPNGGAWWNDCDRTQTAIAAARRRILSTQREAQGGRTESGTRTGPLSSLDRCDLGPCRHTR